ncbi:Glycosyl-phosphatidylinositol-anchored molecule-like protein, partial [Heterocephalus glaber]
ALRLHDCELINTFSCTKTRTCPSGIMHCTTVAIHKYLCLHFHKLLIYKNCTSNFTFVLESEQPLESARLELPLKSTGFYFTHCYNCEYCNDGGLDDVEIDLRHPVIEEKLQDGTVCFMVPELCL